MVYKKLREECKKKEKYKTDRDRIQKIDWSINAIKVGDFFDGFFYEFVIRQTELIESHSKC
jgi:hypothetical protein